MRALSLVVGARRGALSTVEEPRLTAPTQVRIRVEQVGLCPLDRAIFQGRAGTPPAGRAHLIPGHEMVGRVVQRGEAVRGLGLGDYVVATVRRGCPLCVHCRQMAPDRCYTGLFRERGIREEDGFLCELVVEEASVLVPLPPSLGPYGVLVEPLSRVAKALEEVREVQAPLSPRCGHPAHAWDRPAWGRCKRALVLGEDTLALLCTGVLRLAETRVTLASRQPPDSPLACLARSLGANYLSLEEVPPYEVPEWVGPVDLAVDAQARPLPLAEVARALDRNGVLALLEGHRERVRHPSDLGALVEHLAGAGQRLVGCSGSARRHFEQAVRWLEDLHRHWPGLLERVIAHRFPLEEWRRAFQAMGSEALKVTLLL